MWTIIEILGALSVGMCGGFILGALFKDRQWREELDSAIDVPASVVATGDPEMSLRM